MIFKSSPLHVVDHLWWWRKKYFEFHCCGLLGRDTLEPLDPRLYCADIYVANKKEKMHLFFKYFYYYNQHEHEKHPHPHIEQDRGLVMAFILTVHRSSHKGCCDSVVAAKSDLYKYHNVC